MENFMYRDAVGRFSKLVNAELSKMEAIYNFDYGDEFEIACCHIIRSLLPSKYGICRGHIITYDNQEAGDDLIIFDQDNTPTLRLLPSNDFSRKEFIPVESVYAYIEAKHKLIVGEDGENYTKALQQVAAAKALPRKERPRSELLPGYTFNIPVKTGELEHPERMNPMLGAIISRKVQCKNNELKNLKNPGEDEKLAPDVIIAGSDYVVLPSKKKNIKRGDLRIFRDTGNTFSAFHVPDRALAVGLLAILNALSRIDLGLMDWGRVFLEQINNNISDS